MARQIVTQQAVNEAADALATEGQEASIVSVQERIGGGSYSTVKRFLDVWRDERSKDIAQAPETPVDVQAKGQEFARALWAQASKEALKVAELAKAEASAAVVRVSGELSEARSVIARMEGIEADLAAQVELLQTKVRETELAAAGAHAQAQRVPELELVVSGLRAELEVARKESSDKAVEAGRLSGEVEALRRQVQEFMATLGQPK